LPLGKTFLCKLVWQGTDISQGRELTPGGKHKT